MKSVVFDLENNQPSGKIIEIGAIAVDLLEPDFEKSILGKFSCHVNPNEPITEYITQLTGISQEDVENGLQLEDAYNQFVKFYKDNLCDFSIIQWGVGDTTELKQQITSINPNIEWPFGRRFIDVKTVFQSWQLSQGMVKLHKGLKKSCSSLGVQFEGPAHRAFQDAKNTWKLYHNLLGRMKK